MKKHIESDFNTSFWFFKHCLDLDKNTCDNTIMNIYLKKYIKEFILASMINNEEKINNNIKEILNKSDINYNKILDKFLILSRELKLKNSLELSLLYTYLLWNGYFSNNKNFSYKMENRICIPGSYSYDIMCSGATCLNISDMLKDILNKAGYSASNLLNKIDKEKNIKKDYMPDIYRKKEKIKLSSKISSSFFTIISKTKSNHAFTLIKDRKDRLYIYDATNLVYLNLDKITEAKMLCGKGNFLLEPKLSYMVNDSSSRGALDKLNTTLEFSSPYTRKEYILTSENCIDMFKNNINLFDDYYGDIENNINQIIQEVTYFNKNKRKILKQYE